jgi:hypothetical protein
MARASADPGAVQLWPPDERPVGPLMPLRRGHLALLIAAGILNNVVLEQGGDRVPNDSPCSTTSVTTR